MGALCALSRLSHRVRILSIFSRVSRLEYTSILYRVFRSDAVTMSSLLPAEVSSSDSRSSDSDSPGDAVGDFVPGSELEAGSVLNFLESDHDETTVVPNEEAHVEVVDPRPNTNYRQRAARRRGVKRRRPPYAPEGPSDSSSNGELEPTPVPRAICVQWPHGYSWGCALSLDQPPSKGHSRIDERYRFEVSVFCWVLPFVGVALSCRRSGGCACVRDTMET